MAFPKHVHVKRRKPHGAWGLASRLHERVKRQLHAVLSLGSALRGRVGS